jgi:hypothetical protein
VRIIHPRGNRRVSQTVRARLTTPLTRMTSIRVRVDRDRAIGTLTTREIAWINDLTRNWVVLIDERLDSPLATAPDPHQGATTRAWVELPPGMTPGHATTGIIRLTSGTMAHVAGMIIAGGQKTIATEGNPAAHPAGTISDPALRMTMTAGIAGPGVAVVAHHALSIESVIWGRMTCALEGWLAGGKIRVSGWPNAASVVNRVGTVGRPSARHKQQPGAPSRQGCLGYHAARQPW